jgi:hypothetical protein
MKVIDTINDFTNYEMMLLCKNKKMMRDNDVYYYALKQIGEDIYLIKEIYMMSEMSKVIIIEIDTINEVSDIFINSYNYYKNKK